MCLFQFHSFGHWIHQIFLLNWVICDCLESLNALAFISFPNLNTFVRDLFLASYLTRKGTCTFVVPRVLPIYATYCWNCPFVLWCVGLSGPLPEMVKGMRWFARFVGSRYVGYSGMRLFARFVGSRFVGYCLEPAMLCRPLSLHLEVGGWSSQTWETFVRWSFRNGWITFWLRSHYTFCMFDMISRALVMRFCTCFG